MCAMWLLERNDFVKLYWRHHTKPPKQLRDRGFLNEVFINVYMNSVYYEYILCTMKRMKISRHIVGSFARLNSEGLNR